MTVRKKNNIPEATFVYGVMSFSLVLFSLNMYRHDVSQSSLSTMGNSFLIYLTVDTLFGVFDCFGEIQYVGNIDLTHRITIRMSWFWMFRVKMVYDKRVRIRKEVRFHSLISLRKFSPPCDMFHIHYSNLRRCLTIDVIMVTLTYSALRLHFRTPHFLTRFVTVIRTSVFVGAGFFLFF